MRNECGKTRDVSDPYEVWETPDGSWRWKVLKKWQGDDDEEYARWFCCVTSPIVGEDGEYGDVYVSEVKSAARRVDARRPTATTPLTEGVEPEVETRKRYASAVWTLSSEDGEHGPTRECAVLSAISLHPERKGYTASLQRETRERTQYGEVHKFALFQGVRILTEQADRYSDKGLREFLVRAVAELRNRANDPDVEAIFDVSEKVAS
jgi:hypothetical protein